MGKFVSLSNLGAFATRLTEALDTQFVRQPEILKLGALTLQPPAWYFSSGTEHVLANERWYYPIPIAGLTPRHHVFIAFEKDCINHKYYSSAEAHSGQLLIYAHPASIDTPTVPPPDDLKIKYIIAYKNADDTQICAVDTNWAGAHASEIEDRISALEETVSGHTSALSSYGTRITNTESTVSGHTSTLSNHNTRITNTESTVSGHTSTLSNHNTRITNTESTVSGHTSALSSYGTRITNTENNINSLTTWKNSVRDYVLYEGTVDGWRYKTWNNGTLTAFKWADYTIPAISGAWGSGYYVEPTNVFETFPTSFAFLTVPAVTYSVNRIRGNAAIAYNYHNTNADWETTTRHTNRICFFRPSAGQNDVTVRVAWHVEGRWK